MSSGSLLLTVHVVEVGTEMVCASSGAGGGNQSCFCRWWSCHVGEVTPFPWRGTEAPSAKAMSSGELTPHGLAELWGAGESTLGLWGP